MKKLLLLLLLIGAINVQAQQVRIAATLIHGTSFHPIPAAHIINITKSQGTISTKEGYFSMLLNMGDSLKISALGFSDLVLPITDALLAKTKNLRIELNPVIYELAEVNLTPNGPGKFQRDFEKVPIRDEDAPLPGRPTKREVTANPPPPGIESPFDLLYVLFSDKHQELEKLKTLRRQNKYEEWLRSMLHTKVLNEYLQLPEEAHEDFIYFFASQAFHPLEKEYQVYITAKQTLPYFINWMSNK